ncbi:MAG: hypothetical protein K6D54_05490 [Bacteroidales bacterium]|nr:hypothetical protein [Bacteroidales bacterium]
MCFLLGGGSLFGRSGFLLLGGRFLLGRSLLGGLLRRGVVGGLHDVAELGVQRVRLLQQVLADLQVVLLGVSLGLGVHAVLEFVVQVDAFVHQVGNLVVRSLGVDGGEDGAVLDKGAQHILDVFLDTSEIHSVLN